MTVYTRLKNTEGGYFCCPDSEARVPVERRRVVYISPDDDCHAALLAACNAATVSLHVTIYGFTLADLGAVLIAKHLAGLAVGVVADKTQAGGAAERALLQTLVDAGVDVTIATAPTGAINHEKAAIIDVAKGANDNGSFAVYGSWNFSASAQKQENHLQTDNDPSVVAQFWKQYQETQTYGLTHCKQLTPTAAAAPEPLSPDAAALELPPVP